MKIIVTGGKGFLGHHVVEALQRSGANVTALGRADGDLKNPFATHTLLRDADTIIHLAADVGGLGYLRGRPCSSFHDNHQMGMNVIAAACEGNASRLILAGTPCAYAADSPLPLKETALYTGIPSGDTAPYAFAKLATSKAAEALCPLHGVSVTTVIPSNLFGPHDNYEQNRSHVAAALLRKAVVARNTGDSIFEVWGDGSATRDFVYASDVADMIAHLTVNSHPSHAGQTFNLASGQETSMRQLAGVIANVVGDVEPAFTSKKPVGYTHRVMSITHARESLGYLPHTDLEAGLRKTHDWIIASGLHRQWLAESLAEPEPHVMPLTGKRRHAG